MPRQKIKLTDEALSNVKLMASIGCTMESIAEMLTDLGHPISLRSLYNLKRHDQRTRQSFAVGMAQANLRIAEKILQLAMSGHFAALVYWERTRSGIADVQRSEVNHTHQQTNIVIQKQTA
ncbi:hypothetical protein HY772_10160 [Candidatus Woesearchaeota archaeon]|nr:hypothetical protein [Candidatus Woesearchaeota archaeon]